MILGIDEVGRGPWAGPLVVGAVVLGSNIEGLTDSKRLSKKRREELDGRIRTTASGYGLGWSHADEIDSLGLSEALRLATIRAVGQVKTPYHEIIIDGTVNLLEGTTKGKYVTTMKKADLLVPSVSAASIIAKVARDSFMAKQDSVHEGYGFSSHVGYGTVAHLAAIEKLGVTPLHRLSFAPLLKYQTGSRISSTPIRDIKKKAIYTTGMAAEEETANFLKKQGHDIVERNWKTKYCEIDIVSVKGETVYFTEVKYRRQPDQGGGIAAITQKKLRQMEYAAQFYAHSKKLNRSNLRLAVTALSGTPPSVETFMVLD